jgi:hypothetical protein
MNMNIKNSKAAAAGMARATAGRSRSFANKKDILSGIASNECGDEISEGLAEYRERKLILK